MRMCHLNCPKIKPEKTFSSVISQCRLKMAGMSEDGGMTRLSIGFNNIAAVIKVALLIKVTPL